MSLNEVFLELKRGDQSHFNWFYENSKKQLFYNILSYTKNYELSEDLLQETYGDMLPPLIEVGASRSRILLNPVSTS